MGFKMKIIFLGLVLATFVFGGQFAFSASAQVNDYLMVDIKHSAKDDSFSILSVDQVATTPEDVAMKQSGQYKASIFNSTQNKSISSNYFSFAQDSFLDVVLSEDSTSSPAQEDNSKVDQEIILALPLTQSADLGNLAIRIEDAESGKILLEKPLADTTFEVRSVNQFNVNTPPPPLVPIPDNLFPEENFFSKYFWYIVGVIILLVLIGLITRLLIWRRNKNRQFISSQIPPQETIIEPSPTLPEPAPEPMPVPDTVPSSSETNSQENKQ